MYTFDLKFVNELISHMSYTFLNKKRRDVRNIRLGLLDVDQPMIMVSDRQDRLRNETEHGECTHDKRCERMSVQWWDL
jgi:hypothetical protein